LKERPQKRARYDLDACEAQLQKKQAGCANKSTLKRITRWDYQTIYTPSARRLRAWQSRTSRSFKTLVIRFEDWPEIRSILTTKHCNQTFPQSITSNQIHAALKDRPDVRDFSAGGQAKNLNMCARLCKEWKEGYLNKIQALGFNGE